MDYFGLENDTTPDMGTPPDQEPYQFSLDQNQTADVTVPTTEGEPGIERGIESGTGGNPAEAGQQGIPPMPDTDVTATPKQPAAPFATDAPAETPAQPADDGSGMPSIDARVAANTPPDAFPKPSEGGEVPEVGQQAPVGGVQLVGQDTAEPKGHGLGNIADEVIADSPQRFAGMGNEASGDVHGEERGELDPDTVARLQHFADSYNNAIASISRTSAEMQELIDASKAGANPASQSEPTTETGPGTSPSTMQ